AGRDCESCCLPGFRRCQLCGWRGTLRGWRFRSGLTMWGVRHACVPPSSVLGELGMSKRPKCVLSLRFTIKQGFMDSMMNELRIVLDQCALEEDFVAAVLH